MKIRSLIPALILTLTSCGGGGGGGGSSIVGTWRGSLFLTDNTCSFQADDNYEAKYTINSDEARTIVHEQEINTSAEFSFQGPTLAQADTLRVTQQVQDFCGGNPNFPVTIFRTLEINQDSGNILNIQRTQSFSEGCSDTPCTRSWTGIAERID